ncbi:M48 family metalloprotease [Botrimarina colliarenosi]|uniref:M48 family metalloprotease n=1 Tax=Botrimarina colliarenosi TaxID=2528001 RepID=UPI0011B4EFB7|nr:M48 family metalloprotease [Botrimarina colliarenosi]
MTIVAAVFVTVYYLAAMQQESLDALSGPGALPPWQVPAGAAGGALALIGGGSLFKVGALRLGGGRGVAEGLGGRRLVRDTTTDPAERRLLNVVDEMAIASGTPAPPVYLIDDKSVNAFAAGYSPSDAVLGVTRGCVQSLSRDELQGVIAHEFSHILNGDMRMSIRLIGVLHGILLLGLIGRLLLRLVFNTSHHYDSRQSGSDGSGKGGSGVLALLAIAVALLVIGSIGSLFGGLIKAAVSRQREFLADASAVQFTRNPGGIAGALKRIMASVTGSKLSHPRAAELSHMYFSQGVWEGFTSLMATHPPLEDRIRAIEPSWDGSLPSPLVGGVADIGEGVGFAPAPSSDAEVSVESVDNAVDQIGDPLEAHRLYAAELIASIPASVRTAAGDPGGARAVVYGLLLDASPDVRSRQRETLYETADARVVASLFGRLVDDIDGLDARLRLPLIDLSLPSLAAMSFPQYQRFCRSFRALVLADERLTLFEWTLSQVLLRHLRPHFERVRSPRVQYKTLYPLSQECGVLLSALAYACGEEGDAVKGYAAGRDDILREAPAELLSRKACGLDALRPALDKLALAGERHRGRVIDAAAAVICADRHVAVAEAELLRGISDLLDCPMPPLLPGQRLAAS